MTNEELIQDMKDHIASGVGKYEGYSLTDEECKQVIQALKQISHLTDRPCSVCEFHKEDGCSKWECVFEQQQDKVIHNHPCEDCYYNDGEVHAECVVCNKAESEDRG